MAAGEHSRCGGCTYRDAAEVVCQGGAVADVLDVKNRSDLMSRIRGKGNKSTELALVAAFRKAGIKGWRRHLVIRLTLTARCGTLAEHRASALVVKPDFVFRRERVAVFVDGCFWHRCPHHSRLPGNNRKFWAQKLSRNVERDRLANRELRKAGWRVVRVWEHDLARDTEATAALMRRSLCRFLARADT